MVHVGDILRPRSCAVGPSSRALLVSAPLSHSPQLVCTLVSRACNFGEPAFKASASSGGVWPVTEYRRCVTIAEVVQSNNGRCRVDRSLAEAVACRRECAEPSKSSSGVLAGCKLDPTLLRLGRLRLVVACPGALYLRGWSGDYRLGYLR